MPLAIKTPQDTRPAATGPIDSPRLRFKPEVQAWLDRPPMVRLLTDTERAERERERTKDYRFCTLCLQSHDPRRFETDLPICNGCKFGKRAFDFGSRRRGTYYDYVMVASAMAVIQRLRSVACQMHRQRA